MSFLSFDRAIQIRLMLQFLTTMSTMAVLPYIIIYFSALLGTFTTGLMFLGVMAASITGSLLGGYISDRTGRKKIILSAEAAAAAGFLGVALVNSPWVTMPYATFVLFVLIHLCTGAATPVYQALIIDASTPDNRRSIYTFSYWLQNLAVAVGGMTGAFLFMDHHFYLFLGVALCTAVSFAGTALFIRETYIPQKKEGADLKLRPEGCFCNGKWFTAVKHISKHRMFMVFVTAHFMIVSVEEQLTNVIGIRLVADMTEPETIIPGLSMEADGTNMIGILKSENTLLYRLN